MRLLAAGASGVILMALGEGPLRTMELTERVRGYTPRTVYRYSNKLADIGVIERHEEPGVPSKVTHSLTDPKGQELYDLVVAYANASLTRLPDGTIDAHAWGSLAMLADLWESGLIEELNLGPKSSTELARLEHGLSYHQVNRRAGLFARGGFLRENVVPGNRRAYALTEQSRRGMALIAGIGRWRRHHVVPEGTSGLTSREAAVALRTALPLVTLPEHSGKALGLEIVPAGGDQVTDSVWATIEADGKTRCCEGPLPEVDGHAREGVTTFVDAVLDGPQSGLEAGGDEGVVRACFERLHSILWNAWPAGSAAAPEGVAGRDDSPELSYD
ncbi:MAG TPA: winged helix-turn-helix transcriptional regulator [Solirubrobacterales bacterium]|nr:winged helix-turn-helix transcriptional regulator [Solirubrobacterales bacterium]